MPGALWPLRAPAWDPHLEQRCVVKSFHNAHAKTLSASFGCCSSEKNIKGQRSKDK